MVTTSLQTACNGLALLPFELACQILSSECLDAATLVRIRRVCKGWKTLCDRDEIWHMAAYRWGYAPNLALTVQDIKQTKTDENAYFSWLKTWKDLCVAQEALDAELGESRREKKMQYPMSYSFHAAQSETIPGIWQDLWHMKILPEDGTIVSTGIGGGVRVSDLRTHELLWSIPPKMTIPFLQLEAENGLLIWTSPIVASDDEGTMTFMIYKSETLFNDLPRKPLRGHYRPWKVFKHRGYSTKSFRFKYPHLSFVTSRSDLVSWDIETGAKQTVNVGGEPAYYISGLHVDSIDLDPQYAYICANGPAVHVLDRETGRRVWSLETGLTINKIPTMFDLHFTQEIDADARDRLNGRLDGGFETGGVYRAVLEPRELPERESTNRGYEDWLTYLFGVTRPYERSPLGWQAIRICEETNTLVFCSSEHICLLKGYTKFLQDPSEDPEWFAVYRLTAHESPSPSQPAVVKRLLQTESRWKRQIYKDIVTSLSVQNGRALWVSAVPMILDWRNAKSVEDVKVHLLWQDFESPLCAKLDLPSKMDPAKFESAPKCERWRFRQLPQSDYKYSLRMTTCAVLTQTAAYVVETQARRTKHHNVLSVSRGGFGPKPQQRVALRTVRCFDWGRSALLRIAKSQCHAEIEAFAELPERHAVQSTSDCTPSEWTEDWIEDFQQRVMRGEPGSGINTEDPDEDESG